MSVPEPARAVLLRPNLSHPANTGESAWDQAGRRVLDNNAGFLRVLGGPGTGKSTLLADVAAERIANLGVSPENVLVLTANRRAAAFMRSGITRRLAAREAGAHTTQEPLVRTVHSYAFAVLRLQAARDRLPPPRLLSGPEQDVFVRDLLRGDLEAGATDWPESLRSALPVPGFAEQLRDLLLRAAERGVDPNALVDLGHRYQRPEWTAAGRFARQYEQVTLLRGATGSESDAPALDAAELVGSALVAFDTDPELLRSEQERVRYVLVDDAQQLDPQQYWLIRRIGDAATEFLLAGDPDQSIFSFRGADSLCLIDSDPERTRTEVLTVDRRMSTSVRSAVRRLMSELPGAGAQRELVGPEGDQPGSVRVRLFASPAQEAAWVADQLRRAHLLDGVAWSEMAVIVRSKGQSLPVLRRALLAAGVPLDLGADEIPLAKRTGVRPLLTLLRCAARPEKLDPELASELLSSSLGGADPLALRRLGRELRRLELAAGGNQNSEALLVEVLRDEDRLVGLDDVAAAPARRIANLMRRVRKSIDSGETVEATLWTLWKASGLERRWLAQSERGGNIGAQAHRDLDSVVALFDAAARYTDSLPGSDLSGFVDYLASHEIAESTLAPTAPQNDAVAVLTAHSSAGRQWQVIAVPGVQEGTWPDLRLRGSLLGTEKLVDVLSGVDASDHVSATAPLLAEERRLLVVAASRARSHLLVSAVRGEDEQPSRFLSELNGVTDDLDPGDRPLRAPERGLVLSELVGELRRVVCGEDEPSRRREQAAAQLARLASAGVPGAHPDSWYGLPECSSADALVTPDESVRVSPSTVDVLSKCPLRWMIERHGGQDSAELASVTGTLVHALVQAAAEGSGPEELRRALEQAWESVDAGAPWFSRRERDRVERMVEAFLVWMSQSRAELSQVGVERDLDLSLPGRDGGPGFRLRGRVDRLESDESGRQVVVDVKTGKTPVGKDEAQEHPQLAVYQLAAAFGAFAADGADDKSEPGGARLLYVAKPESRSGAATERRQSTMDGKRIQVWLDVVHAAAESSTGPAFLANENVDCPRCPARTVCPVHSAGRQVSP